MKQTYIIAEAGVNHNGSADMAKELIYAAAKAGADAVKFQTFRAEDIVSVNAPKAEYQTKTTSEEESQLEMLKRLELPRSLYPDLITLCKRLGVGFLSAPFDSDSLRFLAKDCDLPVLKIPSGEITNAPLLLQAAGTGKNIILSTGISTLGEVEEALGVLAFGYLSNNEPPSANNFRIAYSEAQKQNILQEKITLLHCTTEYPAPISEVNLAVMDTMKQAFNLPVGYSDHTEGIVVALAAAARGASVVEKHFTLDKTLPGPDHKASIEPNELKHMVEGIRQIEKAVGSNIKAVGEAERKNKTIARKSLVAKQHISKGEKFSDKNITAKRPGSGISPMRYWEIIGKTANRDYERDEILV